jgi:hypothetical protein
MTARRIRDLKTGRERENVSQLFNRTNRDATRRQLTCSVQMFLLHVIT